MGSKTNVAASDMGLQQAATFLSKYLASPAETITRPSSVVAKAIGLGARWLDRRPGLAG